MMGDTTTSSPVAEGSVMLSGWSCPTTYSSCPVSVYVANIGRGPLPPRCCFWAFIRDSTSRGRT